MAHHDFPNEDRHAFLAGGISDGAALLVIAIACVVVLVFMAGCTTPLNVNLNDSNQGGTVGINLTPSPTPTPTPSPTPALFPSGASCATNTDCQSLACIVGVCR